MCIDDEIPFEIPAGWEWCRLGSILSIVSDGTHKTPNYVEHGIPFLSVQNISSGELDLSKIKYITPEEHQQLISRVHPMPGDILVCRIGTLGKAIKITWDFEFSIFVSLGLLRPVFTELADYIVSYINSPWGNRWIQENKVGGGTHTYKINLGDFPNMMICIPPYQEQVRIKERINLFEPSLKSYTKAQEQLDELNATINDTLKKSLLQEAIKGKLVPQNPEDEPAEKLLKRIDAEKQRLVKEGKLRAKDAVSSTIFKGEDNKYYEQIGSKVLDITDEIPFDIPDTWSWCRLGTMARLSIGKTPARGDSRYWTNTAYNWVSISDMKDYGRISDTKEKVSQVAADTIFHGKISHPGDLIMSFKLTVGRTSIIDVPAFHNEAIVTINPLIDDNFTLRDYLFTILPMIANYGESKDAIKGKTLNSSSISSLLIPLPPIKEANRVLSKYWTLLQIIK